MDQTTHAGLRGDLSLHADGVPASLGRLPPGTARQLRLRDLIDLDVRYPERQVRFEIRDEQLPSVIPLLRQNLKYAVDLQGEINPVGFPNMPPIEPDPNLPGTSADREFGINPSVLDFADLFRRLAQYDKAAALREFAAWRQQGDPVFGRLRIWAAGLENFLGDAAASEILANPDNAIFWGSRHQRDLVLSLRSRWQTMPADIRAAIERRVLAGPPPVEGFTTARNRQWRAVAILDRATWLRDQGCVFGTDIEKTLARLRKVVSQWAPAEAARAADSLEARGGSVWTDTSFRELESVPISELIPRAMQSRRRVWGKSLEYDPFAGLCEKRPARVLAGLRYELQKGADVAPPWTQFLYKAAQRTDKPKIATLIGQRVGSPPAASA